MLRLSDLKISLLNTGASFGGPAMALDFVSGTLDPRITFSRGTGATRVNASGFIETVGTTTPRFDYDPVTLAPRGLLIEEARTNILTYSEQFDNAAWVKQNATVTANATASPDGTTNADTVVSNTTSGRHTIDNTVAGATAGATYTMSIYVKKGTQRYCIFGDAGDSSWRLITFDFDTQTITGTANVTSSSATAAGNGWFRLIVTATRALSASYQIFVGFSNASTNVSPPSYVGSTSDTFYAYGAQLEAGAFATSYIPTVASTVSRSADVATMTGTNFSSWYNQPQGVLIANFTLDAGIPSIEGRVATISAGAVGRVVDIYSTTSWVSFNGTTFISSGVAASTSLSIVRAAAAYATGDYALSVNGAAPGTANTVLVNSPTQMTIGSFPGGSNFLNGHIRAIAYYNTRLPNTQLVLLTS
jgi:hypothetical protein